MNGKQAKRLRKAARGRGTTETTYEDVKTPKIIGYGPPDEHGRRAPHYITKITKVIPKTTERKVYHTDKRAFMRMNHHQKNLLMYLIGVRRAA